MKREEFEEAQKIIAEIDQLQEEITEIPRYIVNRSEYEKSGHKNMYIGRVFHRFHKGKNNVLTAYKSPGEDYVVELTEEDLRALVDIRKKKIAELKAELGEIGTKEVAEDEE